MAQMHAETVSAVAGSAPAAVAQEVLAVAGGSPHAPMWPV